MSKTSTVKIYLAPAQWTRTFGKEFYLHEQPFSSLASMTKSDWELRIKGQLFETGKKLNVTGVFMALCYSISYGIAAGFIFYCITKICKKQIRDIHPILWVSTALFILNFVLLAILPNL